MIFGIVVISIENGSLLRVVAPYKKYPEFIATFMHVDELKEELTEKIAEIAGR